jgi:SRSO17 transposase
MPLAQRVPPWETELDALMHRIGHRFARLEARTHAKNYLKALLSPTVHKGSWQLAKAIGEPTPYNFQQFLSRGTWDSNAIRDDLYTYVLEHLGNKQAVLAVGEMSFSKKGENSAGVELQRIRRTRHRRNCQLGIFLVYISPHGCSFVDRTLYLPISWAEDQARCRDAGIPEDIRFATHLEISLSMLQRAIHQRLPVAWVTISDFIYDGQDEEIRSSDKAILMRWLEAVPLAYILPMSEEELDSYLHLGASPMDVSFLLNRIRRIQPSDTDEAKTFQFHEHYYSWYRFPLSRKNGWTHWLLIRKSKNDFDFYICFSREQTSVEELVRVAGCEWTMDRCFEAAKSKTNLDQYEVRQWSSWYRHITLACLAHAILTVASWADGDPTTH